MRTSLSFVSIVALSTALCAGCSAPANGDQGGAVQTNDRTDGDNGGEALATGVMLIAPSGRYALLQRSDVSVVLDVANKTTHELSFLANRFVFANHSDLGYAWDGSGNVVAFDLAQAAGPSTTNASGTPAAAPLAEKWRTSVSSTSATLFSITDDDGALLLSGADRASVIDTKAGALRGELFLPAYPSFIRLLPVSHRAAIVGATSWVDHKPSTPVTFVDVATLDQTRIDVPNCAAPFEVMPDESRGFLSPTWCQEDHASTETQTWTNPDPVSVVDFDAKTGGAHFLKNLPGFGPVTLTPDGNTAVAYLDTARMDPAMFDDKSQVPSASADPFQLMIIDTHSLTFSLTPIGHSLPRFALARDGKQLLVDASVRIERVSAKLEVSINPNGVQVSAGASFGSDAPFGTVDLATHAYTPFQGPIAALDRFVQTADEKVFTLKASADGLGGDLFAVDLASRTTTSLGRSLRDVGILPDGKTLLLRIRLPAVQRADGFHRKEQICFSLDGIGCESTVEYESIAIIPGSNTTCTDYHDC